MTRLYADREAIQVTAAADHAPRAFAWRGEWHPVERIFNRWRVVTDWWSDEAQREYYRLTTSDGRLVEVYRDMVSGRWYLARLYD